MSKSVSSSKYSASKATYLSWIKFLDEGEGRNRQLQVDALLAYWLSYFVFPGLLKDGLHSYVIPLAVLFTKGN